MALVNILHMNTGDGESSYAKNSLLQETGIQNAIPILKHSIKGIAKYGVFKDCITVVDLGCSSSTNTLLVASNIIDIVHEFEKDKGESFVPCFVSAIPGSFYGRLFPDKSLHLVHSATSNHWLSQMPQGIENNGSNICITKISPPNVYHAYGKKIHNDFTKFLQMCSEEVVHGGSMILTIPSRRTVDPTSYECCALFELLGQSLVDMVKEILTRSICPCIFHVRMKFGTSLNPRDRSLDNLNVFKVNWDPCDTDYTNTNDSNELSQIHGKNTSKMVRVALEPLLVSNFGNSIIDVLFKKFEKHVAEYLTKKKARPFL
ncbi:hypothetical protein L1987_63682 [Smallanthus sonchifolius]|uniref:Uncharacterized protein n=1 Tax=Smallanthus sonchifolius TaxID=185202 RepID=A0ACB9CEB0_9ASTR|nr:hypothetical protein L1987_63682 [Smallanthus sonchifolius]